MTFWNSINGLDLLAWVVAGTFAYFWWQNRGSAMRREIADLRCRLHLAELQVGMLKSALRMVVRERDGERETASTLMSLLRSQKGGLVALQNFLRQVEGDRDDLEARIKQGVV